MGESTLKSDQQNSAEWPKYWEYWGLVKQELIFLCWALMEVAIITPFAIFVMGWARFWNSGQLTILLLLLILLPFNLVRLLSALGISRKQQWRILFASFLVTVILSWRALLFAPRSLFDLTWVGEFFAHFGNLGDPLWGRELTLFLFILLSWWRGLRLAHMKPDIQQAGFRLRFGVLLLVPLALILHATGRLWGATPFILLYFLAGLTAISLIRAEQIERERSGFAASLTPGWVFTIFITSLLVVMTAGLIAAIISGEAVSTLSGQLAPIWTALLALMAVSFATLLFLLSPFLNLISYMIEKLADFFALLFANAGINLQPNAAADQNAAQAIGDLLLEGEPALSFSLPQYTYQILAAVIMLGLAALITYFLTRFFRQPTIATQTGMDPTSSSRNEKYSPGLGDRLLARLGFARRWRTAASIRRVYSDMCRSAAAAGYPRGPSETPYEYLSTLYSVWPDNRSETTLITEAYIRVRYGEIPETENELQDIKSSWQQLSAIQPSIKPAPITLE
jgi:hypothetical protein